MPKPIDMPKLKDLIGNAEADELHHAVRSYSGWKQAMKRSWLAIGKGTGKETGAVDAAYLRFQATSVARLVVVGDCNTLLQLDKLLVAWLIKKKTEMLADKLKTHKRFHAMLALSDHVDNLLDEMKMLNKDKLEKVNNMADMTNAIKHTKITLGQAETAKTGKLAVISSFQAMHYLFAPPGSHADPLSEKDKSVCSVLKSQDNPVGESEPVRISKN